MIQIYLEVGKSLAGIKELKQVDIAPRVPDHTNLYPAAYISINDLAPMNLMGDAALVEVELEIEIWVKPYNSSTTKPLNPALRALEQHLGVVSAIRAVVHNLEGNYIRGTTLVTETPSKQEDGFYKIIQKWRGLGAYDVSERKVLSSVPDLVFEE